MISADPVKTIRFGRTSVSAVTGELLTQDTEAIVIAANCRGALPALPRGRGLNARALAGSALEREAMAQAPLILGSALVTGAGELHIHGVRAVIHAVIQESIGAPVRLDDTRRAVRAAFQAASAHRLASLALPLFVESGAASVESDIEEVTDQVVAGLRQTSYRPEKLVVVCRFADHQQWVEAALRFARDRAWVL